MGAVITMIVFPFICLGVVMGLSWFENRVLPPAKLGGVVGQAPRVQEVPASASQSLLAGGDADVVWRARRRAATPRRLDGTRRAPVSPGTRRGGGRFRP
jgi:hypothetical protein